MKQVIRLQQFLPLLLSLFVPFAASAVPNNKTSWNYFGGCFTSDVIYAEKGIYYLPVFGRGVASAWKYGGDYSIVNDDSIALKVEGQRNPSIYWRRGMARKVCGPN